MLSRLRIVRRLSARQERDPIVLGGSRRAELRDHQRELHNFQLRLAVCAGVVLIVFLLLLVRFFYVQVLQHEYYHTLAENNRISIVPIIPNRGLILDRNGAVLAHNYAAYTLEITPAKAGELEPLINELATVVDVAPKDRKRFRKLLEEGHDFASLPIRTRLNDVEVAKFAANKFRFPGVDIRARLFRHYPNGDVASHVVGYIGRLTQSDLDKLDDNGLAANYTGSDYMGKVGLEGRYEADLHGTTGFEEVETDANGRAVRTLRSTLPVSGNNLLLSLDARLQEVAERVFGDRRGALVAIEPATGGAGAGQQARFRPQPVRGRHRSSELGCAQYLARPPAQQPCLARSLSARLDIQAVHGTRGARAGQAQSRITPSSIPAISSSEVRAATAIATGRPAGTAW